MIAKTRVRRKIELLDQSLEEPGFSNSRLSAHQNNLSIAFFGAPPGVEQDGEFSHRGRRSAARRRGARKSGFDDGAAPDAPRGNRLAGKPFKVSGGNSSSRKLACSPSHVAASTSTLAAARPIEVARQDSALTRRPSPSAFFHRRSRRRRHLLWQSRPGNSDTAPGSTSNRPTSRTISSAARGGSLDLILVSDGPAETDKRAIANQSVDVSFVPIERCLPRCANTGR